MTDVLSTNLFDLLGDDSGDGFTPVAKPAPKPAQKAEPAQVAASSDAKRGGSARRGGREGDRGGRRADGERGSYRGRGDGERRGGRRPDGERGPRGPRRDGDSDAPREVAPRFNKEETEHAEDGFERRENGRGGFRGGRGGRGRGTGRGGFRGGREFDRKSGNDWEDGEKKEVAGKGTWGDEVAAQVEEKVSTETKEAVVEVDAAWGEETKPAAEVEAAKPEDAEPEVKSLEQYQAELAAKRAALAVASVRASETTEADFKGQVKFERNEEDEILFAPASEKTKKVKEAKEKPVKIALDIEQRFSDEGRRNNDSRETRGGRGGRGGRGRGGDDRRGPRGGRGGQSRQQPIVNDEASFPSLSK